MLPSPSDPLFVNQLAWRLAAGIAAIAALVAVVLTSMREHANGPQILRSQPRAAALATLVPADTPVSSHPALPVGGNVQNCIEFCTKHVTSERSFVVFSNGSCVIVDEPTNQPVVDALQTLEECSSPNARFITRQIEDGAYLVTYRGAVFHCLFPDKIAEHRTAIESDFLRYLTPAEINSMSPGFQPPFHAKLGLVARARLNQDAADPTVARVIRPKPMAEPSKPGERLEPIEPFGPPEPGVATVPSDPEFLPRIVPPLLP